MTLFDYPKYTVDALVELQGAIVNFNDRYAIWADDGRKDFSHYPVYEKMARDWDGLDLNSIVPVLREARHMINLLAGVDEDV